MLWNKRLLWNKRVLHSYDFFVELALTLSKVLHSKRLCACVFKSPTCVIYVLIMLPLKRSTKTFETMNKIFYTRQKFYSLFYFHDDSEKSKSDATMLNLIIEIFFFASLKQFLFFTHLKKCYLLFYLHNNCMLS